MPENYYCLDNFFSKMTDLESPRKNNDCYFYYYSTCTKGDSCTFRHEPSALGCETTCSFWKEGKCINVHCNFRHMELRKNRKSIPCYWESQPGGCKKPHCPFMHASAKSIEDGETSYLKSQDNKDSDVCNKEVDYVPDSPDYRSVVVNFGEDVCNKEVDYVPGSPDYRPLVVNFDEESDNESAPTQSPVKNQRVVKVKTLEEIRLERIQAESAAYYSYPDSVQQKEEEKDEDHLRNRIIRRLNTKQEVPQQIEVLSLNEIRKRKQRPNIRSESISIKRQKISLRSSRIHDKAKNLTEIKIKTLEEIKNERAMRFASIKRKLEDAEETDSKIMKIEAEESEVTSTSRIDVQNEEKAQCVVSPLQRLQEEDNSQDSNNTEVRLKEKTVFKDDSNKLNKVVEDASVEDNNGKLKEEIVRVDEEVKDVRLSHEVGDGDLKESVEEVKEEKVNVKNVTLDSSKLDDFLLEEDDFETSAVSLRAEEDILKDIDNLLNE